MKNNLKLILAVACLFATIGTQQVARAATLNWSGGAGGAGTAWLTPSNWANLTLLPTTNDIVLFGAAGTASGIGINFNGINVTNTYVGAIVLGGGSTIDRIIGNSSTTGNGLLNIVGVGVGLLTNAVSGRTLSLVVSNPAGTGGTFSMTNVVFPSNR